LFFVIIYIIQYLIDRKEESFTMNRATISIILLIVSLILLVIYGADVFTASAASSEGMRGRGFLPFEEEVRGGAFGGGAVIMSIIAFIIFKNIRSKTISSLLFVNGGLIIAGIIITIFQASASSEDIGGMELTVSLTLLLGAILIGFGVWKVISDRKILSSRQQPS
jgi:hypothetical protein